MTTIDVVTRSTKSTSHTEVCTKCQARESAFASTREAFEAMLVQRNWRQPPSHGHRFYVTNSARVPAVSAMLRAACTTALAGSVLVECPLTPQAFWVLGLPADLDFAPIAHTTVEYRELPGAAAGSPWLCGEPCLRHIVQREERGANTYVAGKRLDAMVDATVAGKSLAGSGGNDWPTQHARELAAAAKGHAALAVGGDPEHVGLAIILGQAAERAAKVAAQVAGQTPAAPRDNTKYPLGCACTKHRIERWRHADPVEFKGWRERFGFQVCADGVTLTCKTCTYKGHGQGRPQGAVVGNGVTFEPGGASYSRAAIEAHHQQKNREAKEAADRAAIQQTEPASATPGRPARVPRKGR
jgi:hypothetical protein